MTTIHPLFAQQSLPIDVVQAPWQQMDAATQEILIILGAVAGVTLLALMWVLVFRKKGGQRSRRHSHHHHHSARESAPEPKTEEEGASEPETGRKGRRHRRRREHRPRNPTLAETGGLPPLRAGRPPDP